jgi:hypothetical protein
MDHHTEQGVEPSGADAVASTDDPGYAPESGEHGGAGAPGAGGPSAEGTGIGGTGDPQAEDPGAAPESGDR